VKLSVVSLAIWAALTGSAASPNAVHAWQDSLQLPTYAEADPDPAPQFAAFHTDEPANYPYPIRNGIHSEPAARSIVAWRTLNLENEYLFCRILPDLGGHVYNCRDKLTNKEVFYTNPVIKKDLIGRRGAWIATGIEPNFPVAHSRVSASPVNFAIRQESGGAASVIVGDTDRVTGLQWRVEYRLRPGVAALEERVSFYNPTFVRKPYYWWNNAEIEWDDPGVRYIFPTRLVVSHNSATLETWPINSSGVDMSIVANDTTESAWFAYDCREPFMAIYKPKSRSGVAHYGDASVLRGKKMYVMGPEEKTIWSKSLTDNFNMMVEMQAGLFTDQETFEFLDPQQSRVFTEMWIPFRSVSGVTRVSPDAVLYADRRKDSAGKPVLWVEVEATRPIQKAHIRILHSGKTIFDTVADLDPKTVWNAGADASSAGPSVIQVLDQRGRVLLEHTEGVYNAGVPSVAKVGPQKMTDWNGPETEWMLVKRENGNELSNQPGFARNDYSIGLRKFPRNPAFQRDAARMALSLFRFEEAAGAAQGVLQKAPLDNEGLYLAGVAQVGLGKDGPALALFSKVSAASGFGIPAAFQMALIAARARDFPAALNLLAPLAADPGRAPHIAAIQIALLRKSGHRSEAAEQFQRWRVLAPDYLLLRHEGTLLGTDDPALWNYFAGDAERVLNVADEYLRLGAWDDTLNLLKHAYSSNNAQFMEPGAVMPENSPLVAYYRAFCEESLKTDPSSDLHLASGLPTRYVFPSRASSYPVLRFAVERNASDATAHALLGDLEAYSLRLDEAVADWEKAVGLNSQLEIPRQDLVKGLALLAKDKRAAKEVAKAPPAASPAPPKPPPAAPPKASGRSAMALADEAMVTAASGSPDRGAAIFNDPAFAAEKQPPLVRRDYIEVQLQSILLLSTGGKCDAVEQQVFTLGNENSNLSFTLDGFGRFMEAAHFQYYLGVIEANCHREKDARKYWSKAAKMSNQASSPEFAYSFLAAARLDASAAKASIGKALQTLESESGDAQVRAFNQTVLRKAIDPTSPAVGQLSKVARETTDAFLQYLATVELTVGARGR